MECVPKSSFMSFVSYVIPCFNCELYIRDCLESVFQQVGVALEVIVVDDGSTDGSVGVIDEFIRCNASKHITLYSHPNNENRGVSASRMLGVQHSRGEFIAFLDADDILIDTSKSFQQLSVLAAHPDVVLVHSAVNIIGDIPADSQAHELHFSQRSAVSPYHLFDMKSCLEINCIANSTVLVRRSCLADFAFEQLFQVEDFVLWHLVACHGYFSCLPGALVGYRQHGSSASSTYNKSVLKRAYASIEFKLTLLVATSSFLQAFAVVLSIPSDFSRLISLYQGQRYSCNSFFVRAACKILRYFSSGFSSLSMFVYRLKAMWR